MALPGGKGGRVIYHVDMNSFYASVEMADDPSLKGKPLAICGNPKERRGIIVTCSYEARKFGVKTTMPLWEAKKLCPQLIVKRPDFKKYRRASLAMFSLLREYTDLVEPVSIDEGYMDMTGRKGNPLETAREIQRRLLEELDLPSSIGIAPNKFLAKTASNMQKPLGITVLRKRDIPLKLWPLDIGEMHGVGEKTAGKLRAIGIRTIGDLAKANDIQLKKLLGINGLRLKERANGKDPRPVDPESIYEYKSIGNSTTLPEDSNDGNYLLEIFRSLAETVSARLKNKSVVSTRLSIMIRYYNWETVTRSEKLENPIQDADELFQYARKLFEKHWNKEPVRLLGITAHDLVEESSAYKQLDLFSYEEDAREESLFEAIALLKKKYGEHIIQKGVKSIRKEGFTGTGFNKDFMTLNKKKG
jgi:impB/mucB/samB family./impB/mucB/samB family C-terminal./IMS family HHH motif.